ncbi:hypothetical protein [Leadbetterella sp. DM7]|uniref:hypothetical protein n=1 Tax=Leadbetterella sp. DM7 TaxID=3235085 RepID=UPI00349EDC07
MKSKFNFPVSSLIITIIFTYSLLGCKSDINDDIASFENIPPVELADLIFNDPDFSDWKNLEAQRITNLYWSDEEERKEKLTFYNNKKISSLEDRNSFSEILGFNDFAELLKHHKLSAEMDRKYNLEKLSDENKLIFADRLSKNSLNFTLNENLLFSSSKARTSAIMCGERPECWKCVFDWLACTGQYTGVYSLLVVENRYGSPFNYSAPAYSTETTQYWNGSQVSGPNIEVYTVEITWVEVHQNQNNWSSNNMLHQFRSMSPSDGCTNYRANCMSQCCPF